jgi:hypothetical protein
MLGYMNAEAYQKIDTKVTFIADQNKGFGQRRKRQFLNLIDIKMTVTMILY